MEHPTTPRADSPEPIPAEIAAWTGPIRSIERPFQGENYAVTLLDAAAGRFVLKRGDTPRAVAELERESRVLEALQDQAPLVARPAGHVIAGSRGHFLFTCIEGENLLGPLLRGDAGERHRWIAAFGAMLRRVHEWRPVLPRPEDWLSDAVAQTQARRAAAGDEVSGWLGLTAHAGRDPTTLAAMLPAWRARIDNAIVFGHGDWCLPNLIARDGRIAGIVDWSGGGYADRRFDLATGCLTIRHNLTDERFVDTFLDAYGYTENREILGLFELLYVL